MLRVQMTGQRLQSMSGRGRQGEGAMTHKMVTVLAVFFLTTGAWATTETVLWSFNPSNGGPFANDLTFDGVNFYGANWEGGNTAGCFNSCGTVFQLSPKSSGGWNETLLYSFDPVNVSDGSNPLGGLVRDKGGNLYGTTYNGGGSTNCDNGCGTVFKLTLSSNGWAETVLYRFTGGIDGGYPYSTLAMDQDGNLYGTAYAGGSMGLGTIYQLSPGPGGNWTQTTLHSFTNSPDGSHPEGPVIIDKTGHLCGTTSQGGAYGYGSVYQLSRLVSGWSLRVLHSFNGNDGAFPAWVAVAVDQAGNLYGTSEAGGINDTGTVWELIYSPTKQTYSEKVLHSFGPQHGVDGNYPWAGVTINSDGILYGTTSQGGTNNWGTIFALALTNNGGWKESVLYSFTGLQDGGQPGGSLVNVSHHLFGIADGGGADFDGVVFEIAPVP